MNKKLSKAARLASSLNEAISPKSRPDIQQNTQNLLSNYREDSPLVLKVSGNDVESDLVVQDSQFRSSKSELIGQPNINILDNQDKTARTTKNKNSGQPKDFILDDQSENFGRPNAGNLDDKTTKSKIRTTKNKTVLDDQSTKNKSLDDQNSKKTGKWDKYEKNRSTAKLGIRPNAELLKKVKKFCIDKEMGVTEFTEIAWLKCMNLDDQNADGLDDKTTFKNKELMMMFKSRPVIINLYYAYNRFFNRNVKWKAKDDQTGASYNEVDPRIVELGIIQTQCNLITDGNTTTTINGFQYYVNEINKFMQYEEQPQLLDMILEINRKNWRTLSGKEIDLSFLEEGSEK
ncbi:MAG: hypothetical protein WA584_23250 [Pyrinomonadaceae bacterium]